MTTKNEIAAATQAGKDGFARGLVAPFQDKSFMATLDSDFSKRNIKLMKAWIKGRTIAMLNAPMPAQD